jgi:hypothetical protein
MRILIQEHGKRKLSLWLPFGKITLGVVLRFIRIDKKPLPKATRLNMIKTMMKMKKIHRCILDIDIKTKDNTKVIVKI